ncbi:MAG TPA: hypothetical protein VH482_03595 [Thermomicrobiales bacterium]|jgi:hypothetical protein
MLLAMATGCSTTVAKPHAFSEHHRVYNLTVDDLHTYFVTIGYEDVLVHNLTPGCDPLSNFRKFLRQLCNRDFKRFLESLEGAAARSGSATRSGDETRAILDEALSRGYSVRGVEEGTWVGGRHIDLHFPGGGDTLHLPVPQGFSP